MGMQENEVLRRALETLTKGKKAEEEMSLQDIQSIIVRSGEKIQVPEPMPLRTAASVLVKQANYEEETATFVEDVPGAYFDGAHAFHEALKEIFGFVFHQGNWGGKIENVPVGVDQIKTIPFGEFEVAGFEGKFSTEFKQSQVDGRVTFRFQAKTLRKNEELVKRVGVTARRIVKESSIYRAKALRVQFRDVMGNNVPVPMPDFIKVDHIKRESLILPRDLENSVANSIFTPIEHHVACKAAGIPTKRGVLLAGPYGTGKTLTSLVTAALAVQHGFTFVYVSHANELPLAIRFAEMFQPAVVFCEDIDRTMAGDERTQSIDEVLNLLDGIDTKGSDIITVLTTNEVDELNKALMRPGRLDAIIEFIRPDAEASGRLLGLYGRGMIDPAANLTNVGEEIKGNTPATIREVVERAKLAEIRLRGGKNTGLMQLSEQALIESARTMKGQLALMAPKEVGETKEQRLWKLMRQLSYEGGMLGRSGGEDIL